MVQLAWRRHTIVLAGALPQLHILLSTSCMVPWRCGGTYSYSELRCCDPNNSPHASCCYYCPRASFTLPTPCPFISMATAKKQSSSLRAHPEWEPSVSRDGYNLDLPDLPESVVLVCRSFAWAPSITKGIWMWASPWTLWSPKRKFLRL
jgi:hypothetical protein